MVASSGTAKSAPSPFGFMDKITGWWKGLKKRTHKRYQRFVTRFQFWSTVGFWFVVIYYAGAKGLFF